MLAAIGSKAGSGRRLDVGRGLQTLDDGASTTKWGCDDTQFSCSPVCLKTIGLVTRSVADSECAGAPDPCGCGCYYDVHWSFCGEAVQCIATHSHSKTLEARVVGDLVCASRGTAKPTISDFRVARDMAPRPVGSCEVRPVAHGDTPAAACVARGEQVSVQTMAKQPTNEDDTDYSLKILSFATPAALAAVLVCLA